MPTLYKTLLINPYGSQNESINLGLCYLAGALKRAGYPCRILDLTRYPMTDAALVEWVNAYGPGLVGLSAKTATASESARVAELLADRLSSTAFVAGGPHVTLCAQTYLQEHPVFSYGVLGEGEETIVELARKLEHGGDVSDLKGVAIRRGKEIVVNAWAPPDNLDALPLPDLDAIEGFSWAGFRYPIVTSRGCPFQCIYCCVNKLTGSRRWRSRTPAGVVDEIQSVANKKNIHQFEVWDDNFTLDLARAKEICREMIRRRLNLSWYCHNGIRADRMDRELANLMARAGCTSVAFGIETGDPELFASIQKGETLRDVVRAVRMVRAAGIRPVGYFIIGLPGDTLERFARTVSFQRSLGLWYHVFGMLIPYPRTEVWDIVQQRGRLLCDITRTRHFADDVVPVSFELPEFPKADMVRAYYLARYFELFEATQRVRWRNKSPRVVYMATDALLPHLPGMATACGSGARHTVFGPRLDERVASLPGWAEVPWRVDWECFSDQRAWRAEPNEAMVIVGESSLIEKHLLFRNAHVILFDPANKLQPLRRLKRRLPPDWRPIRPLIGLSGFLVAVPRLFRPFVLEPIRRTGKSLPRWTQLAKTKLKNRLRLWRDRMLRLLGLAWFNRLKRKIRANKPQKSSFPYEDHPSYM
jgi:anaerobic magnesium-protoporphyrin IX monomethyl ester cyclase